MNESRALGRAEISDFSGFDSCLSGKAAAARESA